MPDLRADGLVNITIRGARYLTAFPSQPPGAPGDQVLVVEWGGQRYLLLANPDAVSIVPVEAVECPRCRQLLVPDTAGKWPLHEMRPGARRSPYCPRSGKPVEPVADVLAEDLAHEVSDAARLILDRAMPGRGAS